MSDLATLLETPTVEQAKGLLRELIADIDKRRAADLQPVIDRLQGDLDERERRHWTKRYAEIEHAWRQPREAVLRQFGTLFSFEAAPPMIVAENKTARSD